MNAMPHKTLLETMNECFDALNPYQKADFLKDKLAYAAASDLAEIVRKRLCSPMSDE